MGLLNFLRPEQQIRYAANKGDGATELSGGPMRSIPITNEDAPVLPAAEQPATVEQTPAENQELVLSEKIIADEPEQGETELENMIEKNKEMIEKSFSQIFSVDNNRDVRIFSEKKDKETTIGTYLSTGFHVKGALHELRRMFVEKYGDAKDLSEEKMNELVKDFCLKNLDKVTCPVDTRTAIEAVCNKGKIHEPQESAPVEKINEKLEKEIDDVWDKFIEVAEELGKKNNTDRDSGLFTGEAKEFFNEEAGKIETLIAEVNGRVKSDGTISEYSEDVLNFFVSHLEKITQLQEEYEKNKEQFRKPEPVENAPVIANKEVKNENIEKSFDKAIARVDKIKNFRIERIQRSEKKIEPIVVADITDVKVSNLQQEEKDKLDMHIKRANWEIEDAKKLLLKNKKALVEKKETTIEQVVETEGNDDKNEIIAQQFIAAATLIEKSDLSREEFERRFGVSLSERIIYRGDLEKELLGDADIIDGHHEYDFTEEQKNEFWKQYPDRKILVEKANDTTNKSKLVVVDGITYFVARDIKEVDPRAISELKKEENKVEELPDMFVDFFVKRAEDCLNEIKPYIDANEDYKLLSKDELNIMTENFVKIFIRKDLLTKRTALNNQFGFDDVAAEKLERYILDKIIQK